VRDAFLIAVKDLRQRSRDRSVYLIGIVAPLGLALVFGIVLGPTQDDAADYEFQARYAVADLDGGPVSRFFVDGFLATASGIELVRVDTADEAIELAEGDPNPVAENPDEVMAAFVIPEGFSDDVQSERPVELQVIANRLHPAEANIGVSMAEGFAGQLTSVRVVTATFEELVGRDIDRLATGLEVLQMPSPVEVVDVTADTKQLDGVTYYSAGMTVFFLFLTVQFGIINLLQERYDGTLSRLLAAPISRSSIIGGKAISAVLVGLFSAAVLIVTTTFTVNADWGNPLGVALLVLGAILAATGIAALVSGFARTADQATLYATNISTVLGLAGGTFFSLDHLGGWVGQLQFISPHAWFMRGLGDLSGGELGAVTTPVLALLLFAVVTGALAMAGLRRGLQP
jgi:ABC-2 type transport system permease protein